MIEVTMFNYEELWDKNRYGFVMRAKAAEGEREYEWQSVNVTLGQIEFAMKYLSDTSEIAFVDGELDIAQRETNDILSASARNF